MPTKASKYCAKCNKMAVAHGLCADHQREQKKERQQRRDNRWLYMYHDPRWSNPTWGLRVKQLAKEPLCAECLKERRVTAATIADHMVPHKGDETLFFDPANLQSLCSYHHNIKTSVEGAFGRPME